MRKHGISFSQPYAWRQQLTRRLGSELAGPSANFARVDVVVAQREKADPEAEGPPPAVARPDAAVPLIASYRAEGLIEIMPPDGATAPPQLSPHGHSHELRRHHVKGVRGCVAPGDQRLGSLDAP
jgi:hypothetical protein